MTEKHIMISYNWCHQKEAEELEDYLKKFNLKVWMDIKGGIEEGYVHERMAEGIEGALAVVCLVSSKYEQSKNCRRELCYCDIKNLPVFPVKVEKDYEGESWLGVMIAGLLYARITKYQVG